MSDYIKLYRSLLDWEWYQNINTKVLFIHMLLKANWKEGRFQGRTIERGSFVSSVAQLSKETSLTQDCVRTALSHLISTKEITKQSYSKYTVFTIKNYDMYQELPKQKPNQIPSSSQASPKQIPTIEEKKEGKKGINNKLYICPEQKSAASEVVIGLPLNSGIEYQVSRSMVDEYKELYPAVDVEQAFRSMRAWLDSNPTRRKTARGINRFINSWLSKEQDRPKIKQTANKFNQFQQNEYDFEKLEEELLSN